jgi:hypothetical protein
MLALEQAPEIYADSLFNWIDGTKPVTEPESHFLDDRADLASLAGQQSSKEVLERYLEKNWYQYFVTKASSPPATLVVGVLFWARMLNIRNRTIERDLPRIRVRLLSITQPLVSDELPG